METSPVRLLLRARYFLTPSLIWIESKPSLVRQIDLSVWFLIIARVEHVASYLRGSLSASDGEKKTEG
ncbi:unnamed protein product [Brassica oleracea]|uniref:Uncharacterized protein n=1 Tax=Brassica oleracea TaxID=3712 RepID=A0A3P6A4C2_BRAOL|nr:unnamed protein product [Brassica oleracea]